MLRFCLQLAWLAHLAEHTADLAAHALAMEAEVENCSELPVTVMRHVRVWRLRECSRRPRLGTSSESRRRISIAAPGKYICTCTCMNTHACGRMDACTHSCRPSEANAPEARKASAAPAPAAPALKGPHCAGQNLVCILGTFFSETKIWPH